MTGANSIKAKALAAFIEEQVCRGAVLWPDSKAKINGVHPRYLYGERTIVELPCQPDEFMLTREMVRHLLVRLWPDDFPSG